MKNILLLLSVVLTFSCAPTKETTVKFNHITKEIQCNDSLTIDIDAQMDDEISLNFRGQKIKELKVTNFHYLYDIENRNGIVYFYSGYLSNYMEKNDWFIFEVKYRKR